MSQSGSIHRRKYMVEKWAKSNKDIEKKTKNYIEKLYMFTNQEVLNKLCIIIHVDIQMKTTTLKKVAAVLKDR